MSINFPSTRVARSVRATLWFSHSSLIRPLPQCSFYVYRRSYATQQVKSKSKTPAGPLIERNLKQKPSMQTNPPTRKRGQLDVTSSIFSDVDGVKPVPKDDEIPSIQSKSKKYGSVERNLEVVGRVLDPVPSARERWQRKMVIRSIRRRGRLSRTETLLRTERSSLSKSHFFKTSVKKLMLLARQVAGKDIDEAMLQMRFSKKKAARDVLEHLKHAKNEAIVRRGMGLGPNSPYRSGVVPPKEKDVLDDNKDPLGKKEVAENPKPVYPIPETPMWKPKNPNPDLTKMYVDQAWVGRGPFEKEVEYRARGRVNLLMKPYTSISVLLKEEKTKFRIAKEKAEKEERRRNEKVWTPLPDRKITAQRQWYCW